MLFASTCFYIKIDFIPISLNDSLAPSTSGYRFIGAHGEEVCHQSGEAGSETALSNEAEFQLRQTDCVVAAFPIPARDVQQIRLHQQQHSQFG